MLRALGIFLCKIDNRVMIIGKKVGICDRLLSNEV